MVVIISNSTPKKDILASLEIDSNVKNLSALFDYIKHDLMEKNYKIEKISDSMLICKSGKFLKREIISIEDLVESNSIIIDMSSEIILIPERVRVWLNRRFLRLKNSVWLILFLIMSIIVPIIIVGYIFERFLMLRVFGIVLLCTAGASTILYTALNPLAVRRRIKQKNQASEMLYEIKALINDFSKKELSGKICWNCFSEIRNNEDVCPNCMVNLKK